MDPPIPFVEHCRLLRLFNARDSSQVYLTKILPFQYISRQLQNLPKQEHISTERTKSPKIGAKVYKYFYSFAFTRSKFSQNRSIFLQQEINLPKQELKYTYVFTDLYILASTQLQNLPKQELKYTYIFKDLYILAFSSKYLPKQELKYTYEFTYLHSLASSSYFGRFWLLAAISLYSQKLQEGNCLASSYKISQNRSIFLQYSKKKISQNRS